MPPEISLQGSRLSLIDDQRQSAMQELKQSQMKKLEIIVQGEYQDFVIDLLERAGVSGWTLIHNLSGKGSHGSHEGHLMFNADDVLVMIITAVPEDLAGPILEGLTPFFNKHMGVVFTSDISVTRLGKFKHPAPAR